MATNTHGSEKVLAIVFPQRHVEKSYGRSMNIYTLGSNFEPHRRLLTGAGSGSRRQNGGFGGAKVLATGNAR